ncbi:methyltransferase domain-containing protein [Streptomyces sp. AN091965]|uniref:methyltransferase domain-containing protein n=1 Tax=Streptomyces sp. AN091965 TaxID=2927803 RepID=UPI001F61F11A|nr:methyltransferase domain-containing protein [Streptomyces sp. AN091965]MCI3927881.1 methyltransferase domain-containing protein [Streptomyces sp. AN091965]
MRTVAAAERARAECADEIDRYECGHFHDRPWLREAFLAVPREAFVPERVWWPHRSPEDGLFPLLDRRTKADQWLRAVYRARSPLITQIADGAVPPHGPTECGDFTGSISCPAVVVDMLHHLDPQPGERILEIGTGTGYNTALLAERAGAAAITSIEIDKDLAEHAETVLRAAGCVPRLVVGDGEEGHPPGAPYDRLISTVAVRQLPQAWVDQVRPGGVILAPLDSPFQCDGLARLTVDGQGRATGSFVGAVDFMKTRGQRAVRSYADLGWPTWSGYRVTVESGEQRVRTLP